MGTSHPESKPWIMQKVHEIQKENTLTILDVGAGSGTYADALIEDSIRANIDAVEVWKPYISEYNLSKKYRVVYEKDIRDHQDFNYDIVIFGDILEHMSEEDALNVWNRVSKQARYAVIAIPIIHYHQPAINGNPYEEHITEDWNSEKVINTFSHIVDSWQGNIVGAFWADFNEK